jgi:hypothetical protein
MYLWGIQRGKAAVLGLVCGVGLALASGAGYAAPAIAVDSSEPDLHVGQPSADAPSIQPDEAGETPETVATLVSPPSDSDLSEDAGYAAHWVIENADNHGQPFAIIDKKGAHLYVYSPSGRLTGDSAILLGAAPGDRSIVDIATRTPASLAPAERTTPAGRFASEPGHNNKGEDIVWFDYDASLAIHRLRPAAPSERRTERLASKSADDKRISYGCIVVPVAFYDAVVSPALGRARGVVYVLPETRSVRDLFDSFELSRR